MTGCSRDRAVARVGEQIDGLARPRVSVIIPHYNDLDGLDKCLAAMARQTYPSDLFEVIVADNNSPRQRADVAAVIAGRARLTVVGERGAGAARNGGVALATGEVLAFTDSDCRPDPGWLSEGVASLAAFDFTGGQMRVLTQDPTRMSDCEAFERLFAFDNESYVRRKGFTVTANLFCHEAVFAAVGGFVTGVISEDHEWCLRATSAGYRLGYAKGAIVGHPARRTWPQLLKKWRRINAESFGLFARSGAGKLRWFCRALLLPLSAVVHTPKVLFAPGVDTIAQRVGALAVLYRLRWWRFGAALQVLIASRRTG